MEIVVGDLRIATYPVGIVILAVLLVILWRRKHSLSYLLCAAVFGFYVLFALDQAFFPIHIGEAYAVDMTFAQFMRSVNLIPFNFDFSELPDIVWLQIFQNVLLTIPFGFGMSFVAQIRAKNLLWLAPAVGLGIETTQLIISLMLRYTYRIIDINDAILNAAGVLIGYGSFRVFAGLYVWATERLGIKHRGLSAYIYEVARRANPQATSHERKL